MSDLEFDRDRRPSAKPTPRQTEHLAEGHIHRSLGQRPRGSVTVGGCLAESHIHLVAGQTVSMAYGQGEIPEGHDTWGVTPGYGDHRPSANPAPCHTGRLAEGHIQRNLGRRPRESVTDVWPKATFIVAWGNAPGNRLRAGVVWLKAIFTLSMVGRRWAWPTATEKFGRDHDTWGVAPGYGEHGLWPRTGWACRPHSS